MANANFVRSVSFLGERETEYMEIVCSICIFDGRESDWLSLKGVCSIYEDGVFEHLTLHNSTSNHASGK